MFKWLIVMLNFAVTLPVHSEQHQIIVYGDDSYPPYSYLENGVAKGLYTEILTTIFAEMEQYEVEIHLVPWKRGLKLLELGKGFALFPPYYYSDQRSYIDVYSDPILNEEVVVYCHPEHLVKSNGALPEWPVDFTEQNIGINLSFALGGNTFWALVKQGQITVKEELGTRHGIMSLHKGRSDCYMNDRLSVIWESNQMVSDRILPNSFKLPNAVSISVEQGYLGFSYDPQKRYPFKSDFVEQFNIHLNKLKTDGSLDQLIKRYAKPDSGK